MSELYSEKELAPLANYIDYESYADDLFMGDFRSVKGKAGFMCSGISETAWRRHQDYRHALYPLIFPFG